MFKDLKENMIIISEQERNLGREIEMIKISENSRMEKCNNEIKRICAGTGANMKLGNQQTHKPDAQPGSERKVRNSCLWSPKISPQELLAANVKTGL
jgi:hypothetical protein